MEAFEINKTKLCENVETMKNLINSDRIYYTMKANGSENVVNIIKDTDIGFEVSTEGELDIISKHKISADRLISSLPIKSIEFIKSAYEYGVTYFTFDCLEELKKLKRYAPNAKKILRIGIRDIDKESYVWGMNIEELKNMLELKECSPDDIDGISLHISRNYQSRLIKPVFDRIDEYVKIFENKENFIVNIGGGFYKELLSYMSYKYNLGAFYEELNSYIRKLKENNNIKVYCEPGRSIVDSCCNLVLPIQLVSKRDNKQCVFVNLNAYKFGTLPNTIERIRDGKTEVIYDSKNILNDMKNKKVQTYFMVDIISDWTEFMKILSDKSLEEGDLLRLVGVGAYSVALSNDYYSRKRIKEIII